MNSERFSFKGFKWNKNLLSAVKKAAYVMIPAIVALLVDNSLITAGIAGVVGPMLLNGIEYFFKED